MVHNSEWLRSRGPLLLAANHPNSFLDAVIIDALFHRPVWSLARGDVFKNKFISRLLSALNILPVYRISEGVENLTSNYNTFSDCVELFRKNGIVLIFSEGRSTNEWRLRPLKKGTARLAISCWEKQIPLRVLPVGINYSSFHRFGKNLFIDFGKPLHSDLLKDTDTDGAKIQAFNRQLHDELKNIVYDIDENDKKKLGEKFFLSVSPLKKMALFLPALLGHIIHAPIYLPVLFFVDKRFSRGDHYDSVQVALLLLIYPVYLLIAATLLWIFVGWIWAIFACAVMPFCAWCAVHIRSR